VATEPTLVLLASPLVGPAVWRRVAEELRSRGRRVLVPAPYGEVIRPDDVVQHLLEEVPAGLPIVLVPHSNAGLYVAALAAQRDARAVLFVDAGLPGSQPETPTAPAPLRRFLSTVADADGVLPRWTEWWPAADVDALFADARARAAVEAEEPRLPLAYFDDVVPSPDGWRTLPAAYLAFGEGYATERADAAANGWPTATLPGRHLHPLVDPRGVSDALLGLLGRLGPM